MNSLQDRVELGSLWENILSAVPNVFGMFMNYQTTKSQSEQDRLAMQIQHDIQMAQLEAQREAAARAAEIEKTRWQAITEAFKAKTAAIDWGTVAKFGLPIAGIGIGIWLIVRKKK